MNFILSKAKQLLALLKTQELETAPAVKRTPVSPQQKDKSKQAEIVELRKRNIWSGKECALLIVALEDIYFGKKERADVIAKLSSKLRSMGRINGANVGDLYRNEAGIALQMLKMEFLLTEGKKGLSGASKAFERIYEFYKTDIDAFNKEFSLESNGLFSPKKTERVENKSKKPVVVVIKKRKMLSTQNNMADNENNKVNDQRASSETQSTDSEEKWKALDGIIANYLTAPEPEIKSEEPIKEEQGYAVELGKILSSMSDDLDDFYNKFHLGGKKQYIITRRMMSAQPESLVSIARHFNVLESEIANIEKSLYSRIKGILEAYKEKIKNLFEQYKHSLECNNTGYFGWGKYYVLLNNLSSFTEFFVDINSNKIIKVQKLGEINPVVARGDASSKLEEQQELREKAPSDNVFEAADTQKSDATDRYSDLSAKIKQTLSEKYKKGFRLDSHIEKQRFKIFYEQLNGETIPDNVPETIVEQLIKRNGIIYENIVYAPENMLDQETRDDLLFYINNSFENGCDVIYFTALYDEFSDRFLTQSILNSDMLKEYLSYINTGYYYIFKEYVAKDKEAKSSVKQEIIKLYLDRPEPFFITDVYASLPHIDKSKILQELRTSSDFISNGREQYFLTDNFNISNEDITKLKGLIEDLLDASTTRFITAAEMMDLIHNRMPSLFENNGFLSELGIRNVISQILKSDFCFKSNVISDKSANIELNDVFEDFAKNNHYFSLQELKNLASDFSSVIYFDAINKYSMRINKDEFISKDQLNFDAKEVDNAVSLFCLDDYTPIQSITTFASFPVVSYKWNPFLLESYLLNYSNEFQLFNHGFCETKVVGAVVKRKCQFNSFYDVLVDAVAKSKCKLEKEDVLEFLCDQGYIARRKYSSINSVIDKARIIRNLKG